MLNSLISCFVGYLSQVSQGLQVCTWNVQLPSNSFEEVAVYALKTIRIDNQDVSVYSSVVKIQDNTLRAGLLHVSLT